ncbi:MAG: hypothetical protein JSR98_20085 [Proteobacteria bacterium]|nr:hypothetical protein [Pseudomonadota bacterium]
MKTTRLLAGAAAASPFANLLGGLKGARAAAPKAEEDKKPEDQAIAAEEDDETKDKDAKAPKGEEGEPKDPTKPDTDGPVSEEEDENKDKDAKADEDDSDEYAAEEDSDDEDMAKAAAAGRKAERARWSRILGAEVVGPHNVALACHLAASTDMSGKQVIAALAVAPTGAAPAPAAARVSRTHERMARVPQPAVGAEAPRASKPASETDSFAAQMAAAVEKSRGKA